MWIIHYCMDYERHYINYKADPSEEELKSMFVGIKSNIIYMGMTIVEISVKGRNYI